MRFIDNSLIVVASIAVSTVAGLDCDGSDETWLAGNDWTQNIKDHVTNAGAYAAIVTDGTGLASLSTQLLLSLGFSFWGMH